jgi:hypothetical protein
VTGLEPAAPVLETSRLPLTNTPRFDPAIIENVPGFVDTRPLSWVSYENRPDGRQFRIRYARYLDSLNSTTRRRSLEYLRAVMRSVVFLGFFDVVYTVVGSSADRSVMNGRLRLGIYLTSPSLGVIADAMR